MLEPRSPSLQANSLPAEPQGKPKNSGMDSLSHLQWICPTQELNLGLLNCRRILYQLSYEGSPGMTLYSVPFRGSVVSDSLQPHGLQYARPPCPKPTPRVYPNSYPLGQCCHPTLSSPVFVFSSCLQPFPGSGSFPMSQFFASGGQSTGVSALASVLSMNIQD